MTKSTPAQPLKSMPEIRKGETNLRILLSVAKDISANDGTTVRAKKIFALLNEEFNVELLGYNRFQRIPVIRFFSYLLSLASTLIRQRFDYVYGCNDLYSFPMLKIIQGLFKYKIVYEAHGIQSVEFRNRKIPVIIVWLVKRYERWVTANSDYVIALSKDILAFHEGCNKNIEVITNFVDTNRYRIDKEKRREIRQRYGIADNVVLGVIGPFYEVHNRHSLDFLRENINRFDPRIKFMVIGRCDKKIESNRLIYTGYVEDYIDHLASLDGVVIPHSIALSGPKTKIVEAMASGLPVFVTPAAFAGLNYATPGKDLFVVDEAELVDKIHESIFNSELIRQVGENARRTVELFYSKDINAQKFARIFKRI